MKEKAFLIILILLTVVIFAIPSFLEAQEIGDYQMISEHERSTNDFEIVATYKPVNIDRVEGLRQMDLYKLVSYFKSDYQLSNQTLAAWFSKIASEKESREIIFTVLHVKKMLVNELVPLPTSQKEIRRYIIIYYATEQQPQPKA
jgi:hypothetical protein